VVFPETSGLAIASIYEDVAFSDSPVAQSREARFGESFSKAFASVLGCNSKMMQISPPSIVAAKDRPYEAVIHSYDEAQARIAFQKKRDALSGIGIPQADSFGELPQGKRIIVIVYLKFAYKELAHSGHILV
jgi:hypothetical protein